AMQLHRRLEHRFELAVTTNRRHNGRLHSLCCETFLGCMRESRVRVQLQPEIHAKIRECAGCRGEEHWLTNAAGPIGRVARLTCTAIARHGAEKWNARWVGFEIDQRRFQSLRCGSH